MTYAVFDLETGIQRALKRKATPFYGILYDRWEL